MRDEVLRKALEINESGVFIVMVAQNAQQALAFSHRGYVLAMSQNRMEGKGEELLNNQRGRKALPGRLNLPIAGP